MEEKEFFEVTLEKDHDDYQKALSLIKTQLSPSTVAHCLRIATDLAKKDLEKEIILAALLHDVLYFEKTPYEQIKTEFGEEVAGIIKETSTIEKVIETNFPKLPANTMISLILSIASNIQTLFIQFSEIVDLLREVELGDKEKKRLILVAQEIFYPISMKLGISDFSWKLQDDIFKLDKPKEYLKIRTAVGKSREEREQIINDMKKEMQEIIPKKINAQVFGRPKNFRSTYEKMIKKNLRFEQILDVYGIRIICEKEKECYEILGNVHQKYDFVKSAFDDYFAKPKADGYHAIHTVIKKNNRYFEIQIRTWQQHLKTESSIYWEYKQINKNKDVDRILSWERQLVEWQKSIGKIANKKGIINKHLFAFTPKNEVVSLPLGATALDFAFSIHTDVGKKASKAKINGINCPLETQLQNLDRVEIETNKNQTMKREWLRIVKSEKARQKIKSHFKIITQKKAASQITQKNIKKIKMANCCHPLPGEDVIGVKTTKRKIIVHKIDCKNIKNIKKDYLIEIGFEKEKGITQIRVRAIDRPGLLGEILEEIKKSGSTLTSSQFKTKKTGFVEAIFEIETKNINKLEKLMEKIDSLPSIQSVERI